MENSRNSVSSSVRRFCRTRGSGAFTRTLSKKRSTLGRSFEMVVSTGWPCDAAIFIVKIGLGAGFEQRWVDGAAAGELRLLQDIADALEAGGQAARNRAWGADLWMRIEARFEIGQIAPAGGHGGVDFVVGEAADDP